MLFFSIYQFKMLVKFIQMVARYTVYNLFVWYICHKSLWHCKHKENKQVSFLHTTKVSPYSCSSLAHKAVVKRLSFKVKLSIQTCPPAYISVCQGLSSFVLQPCSHEGYCVDHPYSRICLCRYSSNNLLSRTNF